MNFIRLNTLTQKDLIESVVAFEIDISKKKIVDIITNIGKLGKDSEVLQMLNCLGQNLESIDTIAGRYFRLGECLGLSSLSRGERVFLVAFAAEVSKKRVYLRYDPQQLTRTNLKLFLTRFKDCPFVNIVYEDGTEYAVYDYIWRDVNGSTVDCR